MVKCDPPQENGEKGECMGTRAMTQHSVSQLHGYDLCIFISKTKSVTVDIINLAANGLVSKETVVPHRW